MGMTDPAVKRRWLRFSLRTLFVVVTLLAVGIGWLTSIVQARRAIRAELERHAGPSFDPYKAIIWEQGSISEFSGRTWTPNPIPWYRRLLGDEPVGTLGLPIDATEEDRRRIQAAFPEAILSTLGDPKRAWSATH